MKRVAPEWSVRGCTRWRGGRQQQEQTSRERTNNRREPTSTRSTRANKIKIKDRDNVGWKAHEGQDKRGERRWGRKSGQDGDSRMR